MSYTRWWSVYRVVGVYVLCLRRCVQTRDGSSVPHVGRGVRTSTADSTVVSFAGL